MGVLRVWRLRTLQKKDSLKITKELLIVVING